MDSEKPETERKVRIAVIDSGIDTSIADLKKQVVKSTGFIVNSEGMIVEDESVQVRNEHGSAIALIIRHLCEKVEFISVNVLNERLTTDGRVLLNAMVHTLNLNPDIIHMSLGTTRWKYKFSQMRIVREALKNGIIVVSAAENEGRVSYPAYLKGVIGVKAFETNEYSCEDFMYYKDFFYAPNGLDGINGTDKLLNRQCRGSSMAAAYITGHAANFLAQADIDKNKKTYKEVIKSLINTSEKNKRIERGIIK